MATASRPGRWKPGESGNPKGRAPGSGEVAKLRATIATHVPAIIAKLAEQAKGGDAAAARLLIERVIPPVKAAELPAAVPMDGASLADRGRSVLSSLSSGDLAPSQAASLLAALASLAQLVEADELVRRIAALEARGSGAGGAT